MIAELSAVGRAHLFIRFSPREMQSRARTPSSLVGHSALRDVVDLLEREKQVDHVFWVDKTGFSDYQQGEGQSQE